MNPKWSVMWECLVKGHDIRMIPIILAGTCKRCGKQVA